MSRYYDQAVRNPDRRFRRILARLGHGPAQLAPPAPPAPPAPARATPQAASPSVEQPARDPGHDRVSLRSEYEALTGKRAFTGWSVEELQGRIAAAREASPE